MNLPLPEANSETVAEVREWLDRFALCVREVDYAAARPFWHPDIVIFGTYQELVKSLSAWTERQPLRNEKQSEISSEHPAEVRSTWLTPVLLTLWGKEPFSRRGGFHSSFPIRSMVHLSVDGANRLK
jgi:hypothetical protein